MKKFLLPVLVSVMTLAFTQKAKAQLSAGITNAVSVLCHGGNNGSATVTASGGQAPYHYSWAPTGDTTATINNLVAGQYTVTVTDALSATATATAYITQPAQLTVSVSVTNATCASMCNGSVNAMVSGGSFTYTYWWANGPTFAAQTNLCPGGTYTVYVTDANGCTASGSGTVGSNAPALAPNVTVGASGCFTCNGMCVSNPTSQAGGPYTFQWNNSSSNDTIASLCPGTYSVTATDASGCSGTQTVNVGVQGLSVNFSATNPTCANSSNGSMTATPVTGVPPFTYAWYPTGQTTQSISNLPAGHYTVVVTDSIGCSISSSDTLVAPPHIYAAVSTQGANCLTSNGSATVVPYGGYPPYTFSWSNSATNDTITGLSAGSYSVIVTDSTGCTGYGGGVVTSGCTNIVNGYVYNDTNANCTFDANETGAVGYVYVNPGGYYDAIDPSGYFEVHVNGTGTYTVTVSPANYVFSCPASGNFTATFTATGDTVTNNIGEVSTIIGNNNNATVQDIWVALASSVARPGFPMSYSIYYGNSGNVPVSGVVVTFTHDALLGNFSATPAATTYSSPTATWNLGTLSAGQSGSIQVTMDVPTLQNGGTIGTILVSSAQIDPVVGDSFPLNNSATDHRVIQGAYDPNLKECSAPGMDSLGEILLTDTTLTYTLHFQNTGTDTAFTIVVRDTLPAQLDGMTVRPGASNHNYVFDNHNGVVEFTFPQIMLPDSGTNEPASHGYVQFTVNTNGFAVGGATISNEADIYFDFNPPVTTNMVNNLIVYPLAVPEYKSTDFTIIPNPFSGSAVITMAPLPGKTNELVILDMTGREVRRQTMSSSTSVMIERGNLDSGVYVCAIYSDGVQVSAQRMVVQ